MTEPTVPIIWTNSVANFDVNKVVDFVPTVESFVKTFTKEFPLDDIEIQISNPPQAKEYHHEHFLIHLHLHLTGGKTLMASGGHQHIHTAFKDAVQKIKHQTDLTDRQKHDHPEPKR